MARFKKMELDVASLRAGDCVLMRYKFNPISACIRFFQNLGKPKHLRSPFNHVAAIVTINGLQFVTESNGGGTKTITSAIGRLHKKTICIRRPNFEFSRVNFNKEAFTFSFKSVKYDYTGTFGEQLIFQTTGLRKSKSKEQGDKKLYCSEYYARLINKLDSSMYEGYYMIDPQDLYIDDRYTTIFEGKADTRC